MTIHEVICSAIECLNEKPYRKQYTAADEAEVLSMVEDGPWIYQLDEYLTDKIIDAMETVEDKIKARHDQIAYDDERDQRVDIVKSSGNGGNGWPILYEGPPGRKRPIIDFQQDMRPLARFVRWVKNILHEGWGI
jgi:hypothetical protein